MSKINVKKILKGEFTYKTLPMAAMISPTPTSPEYKTGIWRTVRPEIDYSKCTKCLLCWVYCPDMAIRREEDNSVKINYDYCKGCGICADVCPTKAISMMDEV